ncbi:MAG: iron-containing alcohol dehydrogenase [Clostridia bacterium]|nr:iron-containing alcohol dehydrogenase [Clostridia bacterium]
MDLQQIVAGMQNCPCGRKHTVHTRLVEISSGLVNRVGEVLAGAGFPRKILLVADNNTLGASKGILESLSTAGFDVKKLIYEDMKYARVESVREVEALTHDVDGILSVGTGSLNDICRVSAFEMKKQFAIFATAPSMDGFASDTAPIVENNFKTSWYCEQPDIILADTKILADSPVELKAAGFGDIIAKYIGMVDWKLSNILTGEYYCDAIAGLTMDAVRRVVAMGEHVVDANEEAAAAVMEALVLTGLAMKLAGTSRPASGAEHVVSHFWECRKLLQGIWPEYHGKKVGVASVLVSRAYRNLAERLPEIHPTADPTNWDEVKAVFGEKMVDEMMKVNTPTITDKIDPALFAEKWPEIRRLILDILPTDEEMVRMMKKAGAATEPAEVHVNDELLALGLRYHGYMRYRVLLTRLLPMIGVDIMDYIQ